jgi:hypothetical protein
MEALKHLTITGRFNGSIQFNYQGHVLYALPDHHTSLEHVHIVFITTATPQDYPEKILPSVRIDWGGTRELESVIQSEQLYDRVSWLQRRLDTDTLEEGEMLADVIDWPARIE